jgi:hypothetical protein
MNNQTGLDVLINTNFLNPLYDFLISREMVNEVTQCVIQFIYFSPIFNSAVNQIVDIMKIQRNAKDFLFMKIMNQVIKLYFQHYIESIVYNTKTADEFKNKIVRKIQKFCLFFNNKMNSSIFYYPIKIFSRKDSEIELYKDQLILFSHYITVFIYGCFYENFENNFIPIKIGDFFKNDSNSVNNMSIRLKQYQNMDTNQKISILLNSYYIMKTSAKKMFEFINDLMSVVYHIDYKRRKKTTLTNFLNPVNNSNDQYWKDMIMRYYPIIQQGLKNLIKDVTLNYLGMEKIINYNRNNSNFHNRFSYTNISFSNETKETVIYKIHEIFYTYYGVQIYGKYDEIIQDELKEIFQANISEELYKMRSNIHPPSYNNSFTNVLISAPAYNNNGHLPIYINNRGLPPNYYNNRGLPPGYTNNRGILPEYVNNRGNQRNLPNYGNIIPAPLLPPRQRINNKKNNNQDNRGNLPNYGNIIPAPRLPPRLIRNNKKNKKNNN